MIVVRKEEIGDFEKVYALVAEAFATAEHSDGTEQDFVVALRKSLAFVAELSLVAELDGEVVGFIMFSKIKIGECDTALALAPLAVAPKSQKRGIGRALVEVGHKIAAELGFELSVVLGSDEYYPKFGYEMAENFGIYPPFELPKQYFMVKKFKDSKVAGTVEYPKEFGI